MDIELLKTKVADGHYEFSQHATDQAFLRGVTEEEVHEAVATAILIEDYPNDKYGPTCLLLGYTAAFRPLHIQCTHPSRPLVKVVTVYEPNLVEWNIDFTTRRGGP